MRGRADGQTVSVSSGVNLNLIHRHRINLWDLYRNRIMVSLSPHTHTPPSTPPPSLIRGWVGRWGARWSRQPVTACLFVQTVLASLPQRVAAGEEGGGGSTLPCVRVRSRASIPIWWISVCEDERRIGCCSARRG